MRWRTQVTQVTKVRTDGWEMVMVGWLGVWASEAEAGAMNDAVSEKNGGTCETCGTDRGAGGAYLRLAPDEKIIKADGDNCHDRDGHGGAQHDPTGADWLC